MKLSTLPLLLLLTLLPLSLCQTQTDSTKLKHAKFNDSLPGCNLNLCVLLSPALPSEYRHQTLFIQDLLASIAGNELEVAIAQTSRPMSVITELTGDITNAILSLDSSKPGNGTKLAGGMRWCRGVLERRYGEVGKVVLLTGSGAVSSDGGGRGVGAARRLRNEGYEMCVVGVGRKYAREMGEIAGGDGLFMVDDFFQLADVAEGLVETVCGKRLL